MFDHEDHYWWFVARRQLALRLFNLRDEGEILDVGCGTGALLAALPADRSIGLDFSEEALVHCAKRGLKNTVHADAQSMPFQSERFSTIVSLDTLEHVPDDRVALREMARVLRPGGTLVLNVPAFRWLWGPHDVALHHHRRYTRPELRAKLLEAGLIVDRISYSVFFLFGFVVLARLVDRFRGGPAKVRLPEVSQGTNKFLIRLMELEADLLMRFSLPLGSSVVAVARKPE